MTVEYHKYINNGIHENTYIITNSDNTFFPFDCTIIKENQINEDLFMNNNIVFDSRLTKTIKKYIPEFGLSILIYDVNFNMIIDLTQYANNHLSIREADIKIIMKKNSK